MFQANILPGQGFAPFEIYKRSSGLSKTGRPVNAGYEPSGVKFYGMLMAASQKEIDQFKQNGHPITHKIIEYSAMEKADAMDYLVTEDGNEYYVQGVKNPANLNVTMIYYVEERFDFKENGGDTE